MGRGEGGMEEGGREVESKAGGGRERGKEGERSMYTCHFTTGLN